MKYPPDSPDFLSAEGLSQGGVLPFGFESRHWRDGVTSFSCSGTSPVRLCGTR